MHRCKARAGVVGRATRAGVELRAREDRRRADRDRVLDLDMVVIDAGAGIGDLDAEAAAVLAAADLPAGNGLLFQLEVGRLVAGRRPVFRPIAEPVAGDQLPEAERAV